MARGGPSTGGSKGGGNVVPTNQPTMSDNTYRSSRPFPSGNRQPISPRSYTNIFTGPRQPTMGGRFGTLGGLGYGPNPLGSAGPRGFVANNYPYGRGMSGYNRYGGMQGPTGLGGFLSRQPAISQRQIDPATGFPARPQSYGAVMGRPPRNPNYDPSRTPSGRVDFGEAVPVDPTRSSGKGGSKGGARTVNPSRPENVQVSDVFMDAVESTPLYGNNPSLSPVEQRDPRADRFVPVQYTGSPAPMMDAGQYLRGGGGGGGVSPIDMSFPPIGLPPRGQISQNQTESERQRIIQEGLNDPRSAVPRRAVLQGNIRPAMNVGKATGGPVGLASLIGMSNGGPTMQEGDGYRGAFNVQRMPPQTEKEARSIFDYDLEMDALNSAQEYLLNRFGRASLPEGRAPRDPATYQVDGIEELIMSSKGMR